MQILAVFLVIAISGIASGNQLPQETLDEIQAQTNKVINEISSNRGITVSDVLSQSKTATEKVLAQPTCHYDCGEYLLTYF